jgi:phosphoglucosamine mutase
MLKFGTDGVRGVANSDLTPEVVLALGRAAARTVPGWGFVLGRDTRRSGPLLEAAFAAGLASEGANVTSLGVAPTPAVAWAAARSGAPAAMVSASHNPFSDNGVKVFAPGGRKLGADLEAELEAELHRLLHHESTGAPRTGDAVGSIEASTAELEGWEEAVCASLEGRDLTGLRVVLDCANGAASALGPEVLRRLGAEVRAIHCEPDGVNINAGCGSTHPEDLQAAVLDQGADVGIALDGDADRALAVDAAGRLVDGDQLLAVLAIDRLERDLLPGRAVVATVMTNLGFRHGMAARGIAVVETPVGDRHVLDALDAESLVLGGEQSGHLIFRDLATTGDGTLTAAQVLDAVARRGPLAELADAAMTRLPQVLRNVRVAARASDVAGRIAAEVHDAETELGDGGRVLVRPSGTEPLVRVMVEAPTEAEAARVADRLVAAVEHAAT